MSEDWFFCMTISYKELLSIKIKIKKTNRQKKKKPKNTTICKYRSFPWQAVCFSQAFPKAVPATDQNFFGLLFVCICSQAMSVVGHCLKYKSSDHSLESMMSNVSDYMNREKQAFCFNKHHKSLWTRSYCRWLRTRIIMLRMFLFISFTTTCFFCWFCFIFF